MAHLLKEFLSFILAVFSHWQTWLSGGGIGGFIVIAFAIREKLFDKGLSKKQYAYLFIVSFFLCSCFLAWVDSDDALRASQISNEHEHAGDLDDLQVAHNLFADSKAQCQYQMGVVDTLRKQNGDQQNTINNCQNQALGMLKPVVFKQTTLPVIMQIAPLTKGDKVAIFLLITNKPMREPKLRVQCGYPLDGTSRISMVGNDTISWGGSTMVQGNVMRVHIAQPDWTPEQPALAILEYKGDDNIRCSFSQW